MRASTSRRDDLRRWLASDDFASEPIIATDGPVTVLDLGRGSALLGEDAEALDVGALGSRIDEAMRAAGVSFAFGRWAEDRPLYRSEHFTGDGEPRTVHLGADLFCKAGTPVSAPMDAVIEIVANNTAPLDYGPVVILRHTAPDGQRFWTLYGHLGTECLKDLRAGMPIGAGEHVATVGTPPTNGNWPPHLHFQVILDLLDMGRDFPGVARRSEQDRWLRLSPNPAPFFPEISASALDARAR